MHAAKKHKIRNFKFVSENNVADERIVKRKLYYHISKLCIARGVGKLKNKIQLNATYYFIMLMLGSTCFGHHYAHHQELTTIALVTT